MRECIECGKEHSRDSDYCSKKCYSRNWCRMNRPVKSVGRFEPTKPKTFFESEAKRREKRLEVLHAKRG